MLDNKNSVIYVGKASNLKKRVSSYFTKSSQSVKTSRLVDNIKSIETIITKNEEEALILENNLIKPIQVAKNINHKDLEITKSEENPFCNWSIIFFTSKGITTLNILTIKRAIAPYKNSFL